MSWLDAIIPWVVFAFILFLLWKPFSPLIMGMWGWITGGLAGLRERVPSSNSTTNKTINYE